MAHRVGHDTLDGGWWPRSRDLATELRDLVDHFPAALGRVTHALISAPDWDDAPASVRAAHGEVRVGTLPRDGAHLVHLTTSSRTTLVVLVVPCHYTDDQGEEALLAAATKGNSHSTTDLLDTVTEHADIDRRDLWSTDG
jgi:hypothetical protein